MDSDYERPPLGCNLTWVTANKRIKELAGAIERFSEKADLYTGLIEMWANEIFDEKKPETYREIVE